LFTMFPESSADAFRRVDSGALIAAPA